MTRCITLNGVVINIGDWDYQIFNTRREIDGVDAIGDPLTVLERVIVNPLPSGAVEEDIDLGWTADGRIVRGDDPLAVLPVVE